MEVRHIFVVEDEAHIRLSLSILLKRAGYRVTSVSDGAKALSLMMESASGGAGSIDLLLIDLQMLSMNGLELIRSVRAHGFKMPILAIASNSGDTDAARALFHEGCDGCIEKPFTEDMLLEKVDALCKRSVVA